MKRRILFAGIALVLALALLEAAARVAEVIAPPVPVDARSLLPYQQLPAEPLLERFEYEGRAYFKVAWAQWPWEVFPVDKSGDEIRVVLIGGSAAAGYGVAQPACFASILERLLNDVAPSGKRVRLLGLTRTGYSSPHFAYLFDQIADAIRPDLVITVMGNNEYLDVAAAYVDRGQAMLAFTWARQLEQHSALARWLRPRLRQPKVSDDLRHWVTDYNRSPQVRAYVQKRLARSLGKIADAAKRNDAPLLVCSVPANHCSFRLREWFFAGEADQPPAFIRARWAMRYGRPETAVEAMRQRLTEKPDDLAAQLVLGLALKQAGDGEGAAEAFNRVKQALESGFGAYNYDDAQVMLATAVRETDGEQACRSLIAPWQAEHEQKPDLNAGLIATLYGIAGEEAKAREWSARFLQNRFNVADADVNRTLLDTARSLPQTEAYDLAGELAKLSPQGIPGYEFFLEYCHYNVRGHIAVAYLLAPAAARWLGFPAQFPAPTQALDAEMQVRLGRENDVPTLDYWAGADFNVGLLVDEFVQDLDDPTAATRDYLVKHGESALGRTYLGNWLTFRFDGGPFSDVARREYERVLANAPDFAPARINLDILQRSLRYQQ